MVICLNCGAWGQTTLDEPCTKCGFSKFEAGNIIVEK